MNCANHPDTPIAAYCQFCGKPLCVQCVHKINNIVGCEPCLAARVAAATAGTYGVTINSKGFQYTASGPIPPGGVQPPPNWGTEPWLAFLLGWIPGVGAMYNGQFAKALAHVVIFALLVDFSHYNGVLGIMVFGWVFYQVFDAYQTAIARRDGLPVPNPLGLNDIAHWFGARNGPPSPVNPGAGYAPNPNATNEGPDPIATGAPSVGNIGTAPGFVSTSEFIPPYVPPPAPPIPPNPTDPMNPFCPRGQWGGNRGIHVGAVVLIVLGVAFLLGNLGILSDYWMERGWPMLLIGLGIWMAIRHSQRPPFGGGR